MPFDGKPPVVDSEVLQALRVFRKARNTLEDKSRWCQGALFSPQYGSACAVGHLMLAGLGWQKAFNHNGADVGTHTALGLVGMSVEGVVSFNDNPRRQHHDILVMFDCAIRRLEQKLVE